MLQLIYVEGVKLQKKQLEAVGNKEEVNEEAARIKKEETEMIKR